MTTTATTNNKGGLNFDDAPTTPQPDPAGIIVASILGDVTIDEVKDVLWQHFGNRDVSINVSVYEKEAGHD